VTQVNKSFEELVHDARKNRFINRNNEDMPVLQSVRRQLSASRSSFVSEIDVETFD